MNIRFGIAVKSILLPILFFTGCATAPQAQANSSFKTCSDDPERQALRSQELQTLAKEDQDDRTAPIDWERVSPRDETRRKRVGEIFGEGCLKSAADYSAAHLIYQHGTVPDHYFQAFLWAKKAYDLGATSKTWDIATGIDRYLVHSGQKQLFGTQFGQDSKDVWCIEPIEKTFPDSRRIEYLKMSLRESIAFFLKFYKSDQSPQDIRDCAHSLMPSPPGTVPGFW